MPNKLRESTTLKIVLVLLVLLNYKYFILGSGESINDWAEANLMILSAWLAREWRKSHYNKTEV